MAGKLALQIYEGDVALRGTDIGNLLARIKNEEIHETANMSLSLEESILPKYCNNPEHIHYKKAVGGGICLAKKYKRLGVFPDQTCSTCQSTVITQTLNYIFGKYYGGRYTAEWRRIKSTKRSKPVREKTNGNTTREEMIEVLQSMPTEHVPIKKKRGRQKGSKNKPKINIVVVETGKNNATKPNKSNVPKSIKPKGPPDKPRGRPKGSKNKTKNEQPKPAKVVAIQPEEQLKKRRGRPPGSKNKKTKDEIPKPEKDMKRKKVRIKEAA